jgi:hypothetical protein
MTVIENDCPRYLCLAFYITDFHVTRKCRAIVLEVTVKTRDGKRPNRRDWSTSKMQG